MIGHSEAISCKQVFKRFSKREVGIVIRESDGLHRVYHAPEKDAFDMIPVRFEQRFDVFLKSVSVTNPKFTSNMQKILSRLGTADFWADYVTELQSDTRSLMQNSKNAEVRELAEQGGLTRNAMLMVLIQRMKARDPEVQFSSLKNSNTENFKETIGKGPFFDKYFTLKTNSSGTAFHGADAHLIQRDAVSGLLQGMSSSLERETYQALSKNLKLWDFVFDSRQRNFTSPEYVTSALKIYLPLQ